MSSLKVVVESERVEGRVTRTHVKPCASRGGTTLFHVSGLFLCWLVYFEA